MHDGSQVPYDMRENATAETDSGGQARNSAKRLKYVYTCTRCGCSVGSEKNTKRACSYSEHLKRCFSNCERDADYIECVLCEFVGVKITQHVKLVHGLSKEEYIEKYGSVICSASQKSYGATGNFDWVKRARERGEDLSEYFASTGEAKSKGILASSKAIEARRKNMSELNKRPERRKRSSEVAKLTSSRPEILAERTQNLKNWRDNNFEEFYEKCVTPMIGASPMNSGVIRQTKPEKVLHELLKNYPSYDFKYAQCIKSNSFQTLSKRKQVDFGDKKSKVYLEFDGIYHFKKFANEKILEKAVISDAALDEQIVVRGWTLIRISYDQFNGKVFNESCVNQLTEILTNPKPGVFKIGDAYKKELNV